MDSALLEGEEKIASGARITGKQPPRPSEAPREARELRFQGRQVPRGSAVWCSLGFYRVPARISRLTVTLSLTG